MHDLDKDVCWTWIKLKLKKMKGKMFSFLCLHNQSDTILRLSQDKSIKGRRVFYVPRNNITKENRKDGGYEVKQMNLRQMLGEVTLWVNNRIIYLSLVTTAMTL